MVYYLPDSILDHVDILVRGNQGLSSFLLELKLGGCGRGSVYMIGGEYKEKIDIKQVYNNKHEILYFEGLRA